MNRPSVQRQIERHDPWRLTCLSRGAVGGIAGLLVLGFLAQAAAAADESSAVGSTSDGATPPAHLLSAEMAAEGKRVFDVHCSPCHGDAGRGGIGPRLTDSETLHGPRFADMVRVITDGVEITGMPRWATKLGPERIAIVAAYVFSLWGTQPDDPADADPNRKPRLRQGLMVWVPAAIWLTR